MLLCIGTFPNFWIECELGEIGSFTFTQCAFLYEAGTLSSRVMKIASLQRVLNLLVIAVFELGGQHPSRYNNT